jgi:hypothetical protein
LKKRATRKFMLGVGVQCAMLQFSNESELWQRAMKRVGDLFLHLF